MRQYAILVRQHELLSTEQISEPAIELAGHNVNPLTGSAHAPLGYYALTLIDLVTREQTPIALPPDAVVGYPHWAPDGSRFAFTLSRSDATELWVGEAAEGRVRAGRDPGSTRPAASRAPGWPTADEGCVGTSPRARIERRRSVQPSIGWPLRRCRANP